MNWFKSLFTSSAQTHEEALPPISLYNYAPRPKDISEPVYSFVECVRNNPKRFIVECRENSGVNIEDFYQTFSVEDKNTQEQWSTMMAGFSALSVMSKPDFLTYDEVVYVVAELKAIYQGRDAKKRSILKNRANRAYDKERKRLMEIYK